MISSKSDATFSLTAALTSSAVTGRAVSATMSTVEPSGTGTLRAVTMILPVRPGSAWVMISAELVSAGMMFSPAALLVRKASVGTSARRPELDMALTTVM